jgi:hypothetical protein
MNPENFVYWLQGYFELLGRDGPLTKAQVKIIKKHLALTLTNVTSDFDDKLDDQGKIDVKKPESDVEKFPNRTWLTEPKLFC